MLVIVPADGQDADLRETGVNTAMIAEALRNLPAQRIVLIVDTCQSGERLKRSASDENTTREKLRQRLSSSPSHTRTARVSAGPLL